MSDTESSSSDNFEDAVESVEIQQSPTSRAKRNTMKRGSGGVMVAPVELTPTEEVQVVTSPDMEDQIEILTGDQISGRDQRWRRLENLRRRGEAACEEESGQSTPLNTTGGTPPDSTESSVEGIYLSGVRGLHPFKVVESDARSIQSDNRSITRSSSNQYPCTDTRAKEDVSEVTGYLEPVLEVSSRQETSRGLQSIPDIVSSSNPVSPPASSPTVMGPPTQPMPPPRRKKTAGSQGAASLEHSSSVESEKEDDVITKPLTLPLSVSNSDSQVPILPSPTSTVAILTKDLERELVRSPAKDNLSVHNLNVHSATRGEFVVRPQDDEARRGSAPSPGECVPQGVSQVGAKLLVVGGQENQENQELGVMQDLLNS